MKQTPRPQDDTALERSLDRQLILGLILGVLLFAGFPIYALREPARLEEAKREQHEEYLRLGSEQYALHCTACHGAEGRGGGIAPTLAAKEFLTAVSDQQLKWLVAGGVPGTTMSSYHIDLGGPFTEQQVEQVVVYLRSLEEGAHSVPTWRNGAQAPARVRVERPQTPRADRERNRNQAENRDKEPERELPQGQRAQAPAANDPSAARYAQTCAACHGARGEGVPNLGKAILTPAYLATRADSTILRIITNGVPGTAMLAFVGTRPGQLSPAQARAMVQWMRAQGASRR